MRSPFFDSGYGAEIKRVCYALILLQSVKSICMATRKENERAFSNWETLADGRRRYWRQRPGGDFGWCRYVKIVDEHEKTISFVQEVYDDDDILIEVHQKYPSDTGHRYLGEEDKSS